jgi:hypothetical protein
MTTHTKLAALAKRYVRNWAAAKGDGLKASIVRSYTSELRQLLGDGPSADSMINAAIQNMKAGK